VITAGKPRDVADVAQDGGGDDGTDPVDLGHGGRGRGELSSKAPFHLAALRVDAAQIDDQVMGELEPGVGDRAVAVCTVRRCRTSIACPAEISLLNPPGTRSHNTACSRHIT
jgi:hypothetical protein